MDTVLLILGVLGSGAVVISAYVFMVAARNYVSESTTDEIQIAATSTRPFIERKPHDRRVRSLIDFPMTVNGMLIPIERRVQPDRRYSVA